MTVAEAIEELKQLPPDAVVMTEGSNRKHLVEADIIFHSNNTVRLLALMEYEDGAMKPEYRRESLILKNAL